MSREVIGETLTEWPANDLLLLAVTVIVIAAVGAIIEFCAKERP